MAAAVAAHPTESPARPLSQHSLSLPITRNSLLSGSSPASSNNSSLSLAGDDEDITITSKRTLLKGKHSSQDDIKLLAVSAQITEITYSISDIQTRIFEIQELRHQAESESSSSNPSTAVIDQALINLDERLEGVSRSIQLVEESLEPVLRPGKIPTTGQVNPVETNILRKHGALMAEWEAVQSEAETLRDELKEDKWLAVFRTVSEQADGMMASLEKAVTQCQDFIWQVQRQRDEAKSTASSAKSYRSDKNPINFEVYTTLQNSFEAKKKYYIPSITKVLSVLDKGVRDRVTKNGECLRRHADMRGRWRNLHDRIERIDNEMESARRYLVNQDKEPALSEASSTISRLTTKSSKQSNLNTPSPSRTSTLGRSMSPIRKFAAKVASGIRSGRNTPNGSPQVRARAPVSEPSSRRTSFFQTFRSPQPSSPAPPVPTSGRPSVSGARLGDETLKAKPRWNSSTKIEDEPPPPSQPPTIRRKSSATALTSSYAVRPPLPNVPARSRTPSSSPYAYHASPANHHPVTPSPKPPSRPPSRSASPFGGLPKARPQTPSQIPAPHYRGYGGSQYSASSSDDYDNYGHTSLMQRALSPSALSTSPSTRAASPPTTPATPGIPQTLRRKASNSKIPVPTFQVNPASRPGSSMSVHRSPSPSMSVSGSASPNRSQTPEVVVKARAGQVPFYGANARPRKSHAPSSFRDGSQPLPRIPPPNSRPSSRAGGSYDRSFTPSLDQNPVPPYVPVSTKDPLDVEVANVVNGIAHGFLIERLDPPMKTPPHPGEEVKAQYAISNALGRKVVTCRLVVLNRSDTQTKKVMCRVGGGWLDLQMYLLNRQAGLQ